MPKASHVDVKSRPTPAAKNQLLSGSYGMKDGLPSWGIPADSGSAARDCGAFPEVMR